MTATIDIVNSRINRLLINGLSLTIFFIIYCVFIAMGNIIVGVFVVGLLLFVFSIFLDKVSLTEKIGHVILSETSIEIFQSNESKLIQNVDLDKVSLKPGIESPLGYKRLASYPTLLLILNLKNNQTIKLHLSNQANNFDSIDKYLAKLNRLGVKIKV